MIINFIKTIEMIKTFFLMSIFFMFSFSTIIQGTENNTNVMQSSNETQPNITDKDKIANRSVLTLDGTLSLQDIAQPPTTQILAPTSTVTNTTNITLINQAKPTNTTNQSNLKNITTATISNTSLINTVQTTTIKTLQGKYQLKLPLQQFRIRNNSILITICNSHVFNITVNKKATNVSSVPVKIVLSSSTKLACDSDYDKLYINLFTKITQFQLKQNLITFYKGNDVIAVANRNQYFALPSDKLEGKWNLQLSSLALNITKNEFIFEGCNRNSLAYTTTLGKQISLKSPAMTLRICNLNNDQIFVNALTRSQFYEIGQSLSFVLYDKNGEGTAYGSIFI